MKLLTIASLTTWLIVAAGCSTVSITSTWKAPDVAPKHFSKIMVAGIIREADRSIRQNMEAHLVEDITEAGYPAVSAFSMYGPKAFHGLDEESLLKKLSGDGVDAVITIVLLDKKKERYYVPGRVIHTPYVGYHDKFWSYYRSLNSRIEEPGYYEEVTRYFWESNFYDLATNKLLYSVQTQSFLPENINSLAHDYGKKIVENMISNHIIVKENKDTAKPM